MAKSFALKVSSINVYKFGAINDKLRAPDLKNAINILPQAHEITIFESLHSPILRARIAMIDMIGLFNNFPLTGEEVIQIKYTTLDEADKSESELYFVIESIEDINIDDTSRGQSYLINCVALESFPNALGTIQEAYEGSIPDIVRKLYEDHIVNKIREFFPTYPLNVLSMENNETTSSTVVIPNIKPFAALDMLSQLACPEVKDRHTYIFFQTLDGFNFRTIQGLVSGSTKQRYALKNKYMYFSDESSLPDSKMRNDNRIVTYLKVQKRHSTLEKILSGYYNNRRVEINIAQKAIHIEDTNEADKVRISSHSPNTERYKEAIKSAVTTEDSSNRVKFVVTTQREHDNDFPISRLRSRWGVDLTTNTGLAQVHLIVTIPGTNRFKAGDLFYLEYPDMNSFTEDNGKENKIDDLITGYYLISEVSHILTIGGYHTTVLGLNKDSYTASIERPSKYA